MQNAAKPDILVIAYNITHLNSDILEHTIFNQLSPQQAQNIRRTQNVTMRNLRLLSRLLLAFGLNILTTQTAKQILPTIQNNAQGKPLLANNIYSISFTQCYPYSACAIRKKEVIDDYANEIGVDIEKIVEVNLDVYHNIFTSAEIAQIKNHQNKNKEFTRLWTIKEAMLKANGLHNTNPLNLTKKSMPYTHIELDQNYYLTLAALKPWQQLQIIIPSQNQPEFYKACLLANS